MPLIAATWSFARDGCAEAVKPLLAGGSALDAVCAVAGAAERDPRVDSVGYGGLPDATGRVTLDACVMVSPGKCGAVCAVARHLAATDLARMVMERTRHVMLAGSGADEFATALGMPECDLLAPEARAAWERWRIGDASVRQADPGRDFGVPLAPEVGERRFDHDTIGALALDASGSLAGACSTAGMAYKLAGRVGDSPIPGHGLYVDPEVGGAVATGVGEIVMGVCGTFLAVESMRRGASPQDAIAEVLGRIDHQFTLEAHQQVGLIVVTRDGRLSSGAIRPGFAVTVADGAGVRVEPPQFVLYPEWTGAAG